MENFGHFAASIPSTGIALIINNAGVGSSGSRLSAVSPEEVLKQVNLHCIGALRVIKAVTPLLNAATIVNITSRLGSIVQNQRGDFVGENFSYAYRIAKCAQNMLSLCLATALELKKTRIISVNPGLLTTESGSADAHTTAEEGAVAVIKTIQEAKKNGVYHAFGDEALY